MSQFSKKFGLPRQGDDPLGPQKGLPKKKGYVPHQSSQPRLNFGSSLRKLTPTGPHKPIVFPSTTSYYDSNPGTQETYSNTPKQQPLRQKDFLNKTTKNNEKKDFYKSLKIDLVSAPDKENEIGDEDELELFNFQKLEGDILAGRSTGTIERITTDNDGSQLEGQTRGSSGVKNVRTFLTKEKDSLFPERMWKTYSNVSGDRNELNITPEIEDRSHLEYRSLSKTPPPLSTGNYHSYAGSLQGTQTVNTNVQRAKIDLSDSSNQKSKNRSNSVMMNRNLREQTNNVSNTSQNRSSSYKKDSSNVDGSGKTHNSALQPLKKVISNTTSPSPINGASSSNVNIPAWNRSGNTKERKKSAHTNYRSNSQVSQVSQVSDKSPSYLRNNASMSSVVKEPVMNKVETSNIKVIARFRPLNKMEQDFTEKSLGADCVMFPNDKSVVTLPDSNIWTFDAVFREHSKQDEIYNFLAKETIDDVLTGYNGTIFAYGMTSSGKTYTMYGDLYDEGLQGIIPRASHHFFDYIRKVEDDVEFVIKCSMLEIYKETLYDLLNNRANDLKIKEDPRKGIYVHGLTEISVCSTEEMMAVLEVGERSRSVAATHLNQYSSRSHTLFIVEIIQRLPNQSEKRGRLNLIDLAGSEKIGKTGAVGETLEEAKKINLSLSCLGNVIHSLTQNAEHVPFRDSKLTRILQESLGGNYKTSLIVTCSPHSFNREETISTLKFATRAKTIKTHYKVNIMNSPESMARLIEQLKGELDAAKLEIHMLKNGETPEKILEVQQARRETDISPFKGLQTYHTEGEVRRSSSQTQLRDRKSRMSSFSGTGQMNVGFKTIIENNLQLTNTLVGSQQNNGGETEKMTSQEGTGDTYGPFKINYELLNQNEMLELRVQTLQSEIEGLKQMNKDKDSLVDKQAREIKQLKETIADYENKFIQFDEGQQMAVIKLSRQSDITENMNVKATVLEKQVHALTDALLNCEQSIEQLLEEKSKIANQKFDELIKETLTFKDLRLTEFFSYDKTYSSLIFSLDGDKKASEEQSGGPTKRSFSGPRAFQQDSYLSHHEGSQIPKAQAQASKVKGMGIMEVPYDIESLLNKDMYGTAIQKSTMNDQISPEMMTYLLRQQLIQCLIVNKHLERVIAAFEWKQIIIAGKGNIKAKEARMQENYVKNIEQVLEKAAMSHQKLRARLNKMELDLEQYVNHVDPKKMAFGTASKAKVLRPFTKDSATKQPLQKRLDNFQSPKSNKDEKRYEAYTGSHKGKAMMGGPFGTIFEEREELNCIKIDDVYRFLADIERDLSLTNGTPNTIDEAKIMLSLKTIATEKMKEFIKHLMDDHCLTGSPMVDHTQSTKADVEELRSENERLCDQMGVVQSELELEKAQNVQMKDAYMDAKKQIDHYARLVEEMELSSRNALRQENETWQKVIEELIANNKREILRKQEEVKKLHEQLASWIYKFLDLQDKKGASPTKDLSAMEAYKKRETADFQQLNGTLNFTGIPTGSKSLTKLDSTSNSMGGTLTPPIIKKS